VSRFVRLSLLTQTTYARLLDLLVTSTVGEIDAASTLVSKQIRGRRYWYVQSYVNAKKIQTYLGVESPELLQLMERWRTAKAEANTRAELVAMARAGGAYVLGAAEARVMEQLAPVFRRGAVLVGSHSFAVLGSALGARWQDAIVRTEDIDLAHDPHIAIAIDPDAKPVELTSALGDALPRFDILDPTSPATSFQVRGSHLQVDLLTPQVGRESDKPIRIPALGAAATPLRFLDYLIEETQPGAVLGGHGALVTVPRPGRYAFHKLIIAGRRRAGSGKANKDRLQAAALLELLINDVPGEVTLAWKAVVKRGPKWVSAVRESVARLDQDIVERLAQFAIKPLIRRG
jgi:hypothetical protein